MVDLDRKRRLAEMAETKPTAKAAKAFIRKAYVCDDATEYTAQKYGIKGEIGNGEDSIRADKSIP